MRTAALLLVFALALGGCVGDDTLEHRLAAIDAESSAPEDADVEDYASALEGADEMCAEDREAVAELAVRARVQVEEGGGSTTVLTILRGLERSVPEDLAPMACSDVAGALVSLMVARGS